MDTSHLSKGTLHVNRNFFWLNAYVRDMMDLTREHAKYIGVKLNLNSSVPDELMVNSDGRRIQQILQNLLSNAIKFSEKGSAITVETTLNDGWIGIGVTDMGIGISE